MNLHPYSAAVIAKQRRETVELTAPLVLPAADYDFSRYRFVVTRDFAEPAITFQRNSLSPSRRNADDLIRRDGVIRGLLLDCRWRSPGVAIHADRFRLVDATILRANGTSLDTSSSREACLDNVAAFYSIGDTPVIDIQSRPETGDVANQLWFHALNITACANDVYFRAKDFVTPDAPGRLTRMIRVRDSQLHAPWERVVEEMEDRDELREILDADAPPEIAEQFEPNPRRRMVVLDGCDSVTFDGVNIRPDDYSGAAAIDLCNDPTHCKFVHCHAYTSAGRLLAQGSQRFTETGTKTEIVTSGVLRDRWNLWD